MKIPYGELMKYRGTQEVQPIYNYPVFKHEYALVQSLLMKDTRILDYGCGTGKIYNEAILPMGFQGEYVGIDNDPTLPAKVNFPLYSSIEELEEIGYGPRHFDMLLMMNVVEHMNVNELYETVIKLNEYIDGNIVIMTPNAKCFDYMFVDPQHTTFYAHEFLYGLCRHLGFNNVQMWRGKGYHQQREEMFAQNPARTNLREMNEFQKQVCLAMGLDWYGNILVIGEREDDEAEG